MKTAAVIPLYHRPRRAGWRVATFAKAGERLGIVGRGRIYSVYMHGESDEAFARLSAITDLLAILPLPKSAGESYGEIQADLESKGEMIGNNDLGLSRTHWLPG